MALTDLTRAEVLRAAAEFDAIGRDVFLARYGFGPARDYFVLIDGRRYDSKALAGAAHGLLAGRSPLSRDQLSGGRDHAVKVLRALGFEVTGLPPRGADVQIADLLRRIRALRPARTPHGPAPHQPVTLLWAIGRAQRGRARITTWDETRTELGDLLARHIPPGSRPRPDYPLLALHRAGLWDFDGEVGDVPTAHGDAALSAWFRRHRPSSGLPAAHHDLLHRSGHARITVVEAILEAHVADARYTALLSDTGLDDPSVAEDAEPGASPVPAPAAAPDAVATAAQYERWCAMLDDRAEAEGAGPVERRARLRHAPLRSAAARRAVLERSGGRCENPACGGAPDDVTDRGAPLLEVDHVLDLALGGPDHPRVMVALCPNCHAVKTRGRTREDLRAVLLDVARSRHEAMGER
ncbi:hypothetical protein ACWGRF_26540 [Streptomyces zhihengii]